MSLLISAMLALQAVVPAVPPDQSQVQAAMDAAAAARTAATTAQTQAAAAVTAAANAQAAVPPVCSQPPAPDAATATAGTGVPCTPRIDAAKQTPIPPASATTVAGGAFSGTWGMTLAAPPSRAIATVEGPTPYHCQITSKTATTFAGKCWLVNTSATLPSVLTSLTGYTLPLLIDTTAGIAVTVLARQ